MKRKNLPLSLVLITIVLGVVSFGFENFKSGDRPAFVSSEDGTVVPEIQSSSDYLSMIRNNQATGVIAPEDYKKVQQQLKSFDSDRTNTTMTWTQLGPDNFGGRTRALLFDNQTANGSVLYGGAVTGGVWKSTNIGVTWTKVNQSTYNLNVSCLAQGPDGTLYAGTGEMFNSNANSGLNEMGYTTGFMGQGIFRSTDGDNFVLLNATSPSYNNVESDWAFINEIDVNQASGTVFAATNSGLKFSTDKGDTWMMAKDTAGTDLSGVAYDVKVSSDGNSVITVVDNSCYVALNGNLNAFQLKSTGDSVSLPMANDVRRIEFAFAPSDPNMVYASVVNKFGSLFSVYLSEDKGSTWRVILPGTTAINIFYGMGIYNNSIAVFPNDPGRVLLGGVDLWEGTRVQETGFYSWVCISENSGNPFFTDYLPASQHIVVFRPGNDNTFFVGNDGGISIGNITNGEYRFESSNRNYFTTQFYNVASSGVENYVLGGAQGNGSILITSTGNTSLQGQKVLGGNGGGCALSLIDRNVMVVSRTGGVLERSEDAGLTYSNQFLGDLSLSVDFFNTPLALWESFNNVNSRDSLYYHARDTIEGGTRIQVLSENSDQPFYYTTPQDVTLYIGDSIQVCDVVSSRLFVASDNIVAMTKDLHKFDKQPEWFTIANSTVNFIGDPQCMAYSSDANHLFVGMRQGGKIYRISNLALAYDYERADVNSSSCIVSTQEIQLYVPGTTTPISQVVTSIAVDQNNPNNVIVTLGNYGNDQYVLFTENALDQTPVFTSKQGNLPAMPVYSSVLEMTNSDLAIIGTEHGVFVNEDIHGSNVQWVKQDEMMGSVPVFQLQQQTVPKVQDTVIFVNGNEVIERIFPGTNNYGIIYAATFGRGLMRSNAYRKPVGIDENEMETPANATTALHLYPNPVSSIATIEFNMNRNDLMVIHVYDLSGRQVIQTTENVYQGNNSVQLDMSGLRSGTYVISAVAGSNKFSQKFIVK